MFIEGKKKGHVLRENFVVDGIESLGAHGWCLIFDGVHLWLRGLERSCGGCMGWSGAV